MKIIPDTNVLVRALVDDDPVQSPAASDQLHLADKVVLTLPALCELVWVLRSNYRLPKSDIAQTLRGFAEASNVVVDVPALTAGLAVLEAGGDFADGAIAHDGVRSGGEVFLSFDRKAVRLVHDLSIEAQSP